MTVNKRSPNYDKSPKVAVKGYESHYWEGWESIVSQIQVDIKSVSKTIVCVETNHGVIDEELLPNLSQGLNPSLVIESKDAFIPPGEVDKLLEPFLGGDDPVYGWLCNLNIESFFSPEKKETLTEKIKSQKEGLILVYGAGSSLLCNPDILVYADIARWEIQMRFRKNIISNLGVENKDLTPSIQYKRAYFVDWRVFDKIKKKTIEKWDYVLDTNIQSSPKMSTGLAVREGLSQTAIRPFRVVPYFDPGVWGGQWMREVCDLDPEPVNFAWCFDCVPEENSMYLGFGDKYLEIPSINLVFYEPQKLLGPAVYGRFGAEFPIRFDFLDTMGGQNLSFQVHPTTEYIQETFGMHYTQDESYYMLDAGDDGTVYLGLKEETDPDEMISALEEAQEGRYPFPAEKFVNIWPAKKHDHFLIPAGTVHCSGTNGMVLEISATTYIFTFKLWDWGRVNLDGKPRPIHIDHGKNVIQWDRKTKWVKENLVNVFEPVGEGDGWKEEKTGLHELEFIETRRHWFSRLVTHNTENGVNVLNLVEGEEAIIESPSGAFEPFVVHYAETFIIPAKVGIYTIRPFGLSEGKECATIKAFVRTNP